MYKKSYLILICFLISFCIKAQKFTPDTSKSGNLLRAAKVMTGFVNGIYPSFPLITTVIPSTSGVDPKGTQIYVTGDSTFYIWSGTQWIGIERKNINWSLTGNNGTVAGTNFIGTKDAIDWVIKTNNTERARVTSSGTATFLKDALVNGLTVGRGGGDISSNTSIGSTALLNNTTGQINSSFGSDALFSNTTGTYNTAIGGQSLYSNTISDYNTSVGAISLYDNIGSKNSALGAFSLSHNTIGVENTAIGHEAGTFNTIGSDNTAIGVGSLKSNTTGAGNVAVGTSALLLGTVSGNTAIGVNSLRNSTGDNNTAVGYQSALGLTSGTNNIRVGIGGTGITTGSNNVLLGDFTSTLPAGTSNRVEIRDGAGNLALRKDNLGNSRINVQALQVVTVSAAGTLTLDAESSDYVFSGTTTTWTLPPLTGYTNVKYFIKNRGTGAITLNSNAGGNDIYTTSAVNTFTINAGAAYILMNDGTYWDVE